ncbi:MAG: thioredoxin-disulfide reductase [Desulfobacteraceae bacterium 4572_35.1]|nr:MAG: thioredoxin-disulfide reductase [Desulfobacteraceae bacterium 4572_35.1]
MAEQNDKDNKTRYDVVIIGGGPAGLTAGLYCSRARLKTLLVEKMLLGGQVMTTTEVENYPGFPGGIAGPELMERMQEHCQEFGLEVQTAQVEKVENDGAVKKVVLDSGVIESRSVIIASGAQPRKLGVPGEQELTGRGVSYCATCDGAFYRNMTVAINGGGDTAVEEALFLTRFASKVYLIHRRDQLRAVSVLQERLHANDKIEVIWNSVIESCEGDNSGLTHLVLKDVNTGSTSKLEVQGVFIAIGVEPKTGFLHGTVDLDDGGYIVTDMQCRTSVPGIFAAGDVRQGVLKQIATAVGAGATAAYEVERYLADLE